MSVADFNNGIKTILDALGSDYQWTDNAGGVRSVRAAITTLGAEDAPLVNAVGIDARIMYLEPVTPGPSKFDTFANQFGAVYAAHDVHPIIIDNQLVGYKMVVKE